MARPLTAAELFDDLKTDVGVELGEIRASLGLTQADVARRMGTHQAKVARIEHGLENLRLSTLARLAAALESPVFIAFDAPTELNHWQRWVRERRERPAADLQPGPPAANSFATSGLTTLPIALRGRAPTQRRSFGTL